MASDSISIKQNDLNEIKKTEVVALESGNSDVGNKSASEQTVVKLPEPSIEINLDEIFKEPLPEISSVGIGFRFYWTLFKHK